MTEFEICDECECEVEQELAENEFSFICPYCGKLVMACNKCIYLQQVNTGTYNCDWNNKTNTCFRKGDYKNE